MRRFGSQPGEIASFDLALGLRRVEARRMERERRELARADRRARRWAWIRAAIGLRGEG
jgi:hypothetical protein